MQSAQLDIVIDDRFGNPVKPQEWFLVPLNIVDQIILRIKDSTLDLYNYNPVTGTLEKMGLNE